MISIICFVIFATLSGYLEAYFWVSRPRVGQTSSHMMLSLLRATVLFPILWYNGFWAFASCVLIFPFFHDGMYYRTRNKISSNIYPKGWWDTSYTTGAMISFNTFERTIFAVVGLLTIIAFVI